MAEKCDICSAPIEIIFLEKIKGTYIKDKKGKKKVVCSNCQKEYKELKEKI